MHNRSKENRKSYFHEVFIISNEMQICPHLHHDCALSLSSRLFHCIPFQTQKSSAVFNACVLELEDSTVATWRSIQDANQPRYYVEGLAHEY